MWGFVIESNIDTDIELFDKTKEEKEASKTEKEIFLTSCSRKYLQNFLSDE